MKIGFEREFFVYNVNGELVEAKGLPMDECGYLAESRGEPSTIPIQAAFNLYAIEEELKNTAKLLKLTLSTNITTANLAPAFKAHCLRTYGKNPVTRELGSMYGKFYSPTDKYSRAGLHVHFSDFRTIIHTFTGSKCDTCHTVHTETQKTEVPGIIDMPRFIFGLDKFFAKEIREAKRIPGLYEMKEHGFEYRSLPSNIDVVRVAKAVTYLMRERWNSTIVLEA